MTKVTKDWTLSSPGNKGLTGKLLFNFEPL